MVETAGGAVVTGLGVACGPLDGAAGLAAGVLGPEAFDAVPFLALLTAYGSPWGMREGG